MILYGESGTGKELFAHAIHSASGRRGERFVAVNCGSIPAQLVEAELFGYEAGTFTGARRDGNPGRFEDADGGTLFLDEVSELPLPGADGAAARPAGEGGRPPRRQRSRGSVDVRVVAATNKPLEEEIRPKRFRRDLFYRLNVLSISVPPLRDRGDDDSRSSPRSSSPRRRRRCGAPASRSPTTRWPCSRPTLGRGTCAS